MALTYIIILTSVILIHYYYINIKMFRILIWILNIKLKCPGEYLNNTLSTTRQSWRRGVRASTVFKVWQSLAASITGIFQYSIYCQVL